LTLIYLKTLLFTLHIYYIYRARKKEKRFKYSTTYFFLLFQEIEELKLWFMDAPVVMRDEQVSARSILGFRFIMVLGQNLRFLVDQRVSFYKLTVDIDGVFGGVLLEAEKNRFAGGV
jgi:cbb3-type cytochrome oxidase subunit 3